MAVTHTVQAGETLWSISRLYEVSLDALRLANALTTDLIYPGQELIIPEAAAQPSETVPSATLPSLEGGFVLPEGSYTTQDLQDLALLARLVFAEARGEPFEGQVAVAAVLLNRVRHPEFPNTVAEAVYQPGQFEPVANGSINLTPNNLAYLAVLEAWGGADPTDGALFFWNPRKVPASSWVWTRPVKLQIGQHVFA
ncbi:MAG: LysM peptidoglycan-binding domain-containing protein [Firmicutes bacterium]|nr:LysM peptidoglycan-binding domain-containing protein [Bacillota bacterium]